MLDFRTVLSYRKSSPNQQQYFRLLELPIELQKLIFDFCYQPWELEIVDNYWHMCESPYFCMDKYSQNPDYRAAVLYGAPSASLSMTCRHIYNHTEASLLKSYTGLLRISIYSSYLALPVLPSRFSRIYGLTEELNMEERAFADLFSPKDFPSLKELIINCRAILQSSLPMGRTYPLSDAGLQKWAKKYQRLLERRSGKSLTSDKFLTILNTPAEQSGESDGFVYCHHAQKQDDVRVVRDWLTTKEDEAEQTSEDLAS